MPNTIRKNYFRDELPLSKWLLTGATLQSVAIVVLPKYVALGLCFLLASVHIILLSLTSFGLRRNARLDDVRPGVFSARLPKTSVAGNDASSATAGQLQAEVPNKSDKDDQMVIFLLGSRTTDVKGRLSAEYKELASLYMTIMTEAARPENRARYGFLGQCAPLIGTELDQTNVAINISYWRSREGLMAFARESAAHRQAWTWFADGMEAESGNKTGNGNGVKRANIGIMHELYYYNESKASRIYANFKPWGFLQAKFQTSDNETGGATLTGPSITEKAVRWPPNIKGVKTSPA